jgi:hypothetical protein
MRNLAEGGYIERAELNTLGSPESKAGLRIRH